MGADLKRIRSYVERYVGDKVPVIVHRSSDAEYPIYAPVAESQYIAIRLRGGVEELGDTLRELSKREITLIVVAVERHSATFYALMESVMVAFEVDLRELGRAI